ncbi:pilus assembly PilX N-terminal domain-containing protein [Patescibacteria group bacterium]
MKRNSSIVKQKGVSVYLALIIMSIMLAIGLALSTMFIVQLKLISSIGDSVVALYAADSGIEYELYQSRKTLRDVGGIFPPFPVNEKCLDISLDGNCDISAPGCLEEDGGPLDPNDACYRVEVVRYPGQPPDPAANYTVRSVGVYKGTRRAIEIEIGGVVLPPEGEPVWQTLCNSGDPDPNNFFLLNMMDYWGYEFTVSTIGIATKLCGRFITQDVLDAVPVGLYIPGNPPTLLGHVNITNTNALTWVCADIIPDTALDPIILNPSSTYWVLVAGNPPDPELIQHAYNDSVSWDDCGSDIYIDRAIFIMDNGNVGEFDDRMYGMVDMYFLSP